MIVVGDGDQVAELKSIAVYPDYQGKDLGRRLVDAVIEHAARAGATRLVVTTASADTGNLRFYQKTGFRMVRIVRDFFTADSGYAPKAVINGIPLRDQVVLDRTI